MASAPRPPLRPPHPLQGLRSLLCASGMLLGRMADVASPGWQLGGEHLRLADCCSFQEFQERRHRNQSEDGEVGAQGVASCWGEGQGRRLGRSLEGQGPLEGTQRPERAESRCGACGDPGSEPRCFLWFCVYGCGFLVSWAEMRLVLSAVRQVGPRQRGRQEGARHPPSHLFLPYLWVFRVRELRVCALFTEVSTETGPGHTPTIRMPSRFHSAHRFWSRAVATWLALQ